MPRSAARLPGPTGFPPKPWSRAIDFPQMGERNAWRAKKSSRCSLYLYANGADTLYRYTAPTSQAPLGRRFRQECAYAQYRYYRGYDRVGRNKSCGDSNTSQNNYGSEGDATEKSYEKLFDENQNLHSLSISVRVWPRFDRTLQQRRWHSSPNSSEKPISI